MQVWVPIWPVAISQSVLPYSLTSFQKPIPCVNPVNKGSKCPKKHLKSMKREKGAATTKAQKNMIKAWDLAGSMLALTCLNMTAFWFWALITV